MDEIRIYNNTGEEIPDRSFVKLKLGGFSPSYGQYKGLHYWEVEKPDYDNMEESLLAVTKESVPDGYIGIAQLGGIAIVEKTSGETIAADDNIGTDEAQWTAIKIADDADGFNDGQFRVLSVFGDSDEYLVVRPRIRENMFAS